MYRNDVRGVAIACEAEVILFLSVVESDKKGSPLSEHAERLYAGSIAAAVESRYHQAPKATMHCFAWVA